MFEVNDYLIYMREVCQVKEIKKKYLRDKDYYLLVPVGDDSLKNLVPVDSELIRDLISRERIDEIIKKIPEIQVSDLTSKKMEEEYKKLLLSGEHEDLVKIIKMTYLRNKERLDNNKKTTDKDTYYFELAERYLYNEFMIVMNMEYEEVKRYVIDEVKRLVK